MRWLRTAAVLLVLGLRTEAQQGPASTAQQTPVSRAEVHLEPHDGRTHFQLGDPVRLDLVFQDAAFPDVRAEQPKQPHAWLPLPGQRSVNSIDYGDLADTVSITPAEGWFRWQGRSSHDYGTATPVDATGVRIAVLLNQGLVFREPGEYQVTVTTARMGKPVTTNAVTIEVAPRRAEDEAALLSALSATIEDSSGAERKAAAQRLAYLPGDDAARAKVQWLLKGHNEVRTAMVGGLASTRNQQMQLSLLKAAWVDPNRAPDGLLQAALRNAERFARNEPLPGWAMVISPKTDPVSRALAAEYSEDLQRVLATLPQRIGEVRRDTAYYLVQDNSLSAEQLALVKPVLLEEFPRMSPMAQSMLVETRWQAIRDASLAPALRAMIDSRERWMDGATATERLIEIDERAARPYVVQMICRPERGLLLNKLNGFHEDRLPEVDACLTAILAPGERREHDFEWEQAALRAARFATPAILPALKKAWTSASQDSVMLAVLMRDAPQEAVALLDREPEIDWYPVGTVYESLGQKYPAEVLAWLRGPKAPQRSAYELSRFGEPGDRRLLETKLQALRARWHGHEADIENAQPDTPAYKMKSEEQDLVSSLVTSKIWTLSPAEHKQLTDACLGDWCKRYAPHPGTQANQ